MYSRVKEGYTAKGISGVVCKLLQIKYTDESGHIALGSNSHPPQESDPPIACLPNSEEAGVKLREGSRKRNLRGGI